MNNINYNIHNQDELFGTDHKDFLVGNLVDKLHYLFVKLIAAVSDSNCTFNSMFCNLLIECSSIINNQCKLFNFVLLTSFSYALSALEIRFTISFIADQNNRFVMKLYEENISLKEI